MPAKIEITAKMRSETLKRHRQDETVAEIVAALGVSRKIINRIFASEGVTLRKGPRASTPRNWGTQRLAEQTSAAVVREYLSGASRHALAVKFKTNCQRIDQVLKRNNVPLRDDRTRRGPANPIFKTGRSLNKEGYVRTLIPEDSPFAEMGSSRRTVLEHRLVMAQHLGRPLSPYERVHHINGQRADNRIENLELWEESHPPGQRNGEATHQHCPTCTC